MAANLNKAIREIQQNLSDPEVKDHLQKIRKYTENDIETAYLLGKFIKTNTGQKLPEDAKKKLLREVRNNNLEDYFYLKDHPQKDRIDVILCLFLLGGGIALIYLAFKGNFLDALTFVPSGKDHRGGGMPGILVFVALIVAGIRLSYEIKKKRFIAYLDKSQKESIATN